MSLEIKDIHTPDEEKKDKKSFYLFIGIKNAF